MLMDSSVASKMACVRSTWNKICQHGSLHQRYFDSVPEGKLHTVDLTADDLAQPCDPQMSLSSTSCKRVHTRSGVDLKSEGSQGSPSKESVECGIGQSSFASRSSVEGAQCASPRSGLRHT